MKLNNLNIKEARKGLENKDFSSLDLTKACLDQIKKLEGKLNAFVTITEKEALKQAEAADELISSGQDLPLLGIPIAIKDNFQHSELKLRLRAKF